MVQKAILERVRHLAVLREEAEEKNLDENIQMLWKDVFYRWCGLMQDLDAMETIPFKESKRCTPHESEFRYGEHGLVLALLGYWLGDKRIGDDGKSSSWRQQELQFDLVMIQLAQAPKESFVYPDNSNLNLRLSALIKKLLETLPLKCKNDVLETLTKIQGFI